MARKKTTKKAAKKTAKKAGKKRVTKAKDLSQAHGKEEDKFQPTTLDQIWGDDGTSRYRTQDEGEYKSQIDDMNRTDLHLHASKVGLIPIENSTQLKKRLIAEFKKHISQYRKPVFNQKPPLKLSKEAWKTLEEGK